MKNISRARLAEAIRTGIYADFPTTVNAIWGLHYRANPRDPRKSAVKNYTRLRVREARESAVKK